MSDNSDLNERLLQLENEVRELKKERADKTEKKKDKSEKKPREKTEYNIFVSTYINEQKELLGSEFNHKLAFSGAAKKWKEHKENNNK